VCSMRSYESYVVRCSSMKGFHLDAMIPTVLSCRASGDKRVTKALEIVLSCVLGERRQQNCEISRGDSRMMQRHVRK